MSSPNRRLVGGLAQSFAAGYSTTTASMIGEAPRFSSALATRPDSFRRVRASLIFTAFLVAAYNKPMENKSGILAISRHAESEWNLLGKWTGITDVSLTEKGHIDSKMLGETLRGIHFTVAYHSEQHRTHQTLDGILETHGQTDLERREHSGINERDYGELTGKNKWEVQKEIGDEAFKGIRRGWDYPVPGGETLKDVHGRVVPFFDEEILPRLKKGENVLLVAHNNSIRALLKHLDNIEEAAIANIEIPFGQILLYHFTPEGRVDEKESLSIHTDQSNA